MLFYLLRIVCNKIDGGIGLLRKHTQLCCERHKGRTCGEGKRSQSCRRTRSGFDLFGCRLNSLKVVENDFSIPGWFLG